jgi:Flp pilus assembly protein protease CpaA
MEIILIIAMLGAIAAGYYDLKTTEVPAEIPALMISGGLFYWFVSALTTGDFFPLYISVSAGLVVLALGLSMYRLGQWGEADAWMLASVAFMVPVFNGGIFAFPFTVNLFMVGAAYTIVYAAALGLMNPDVARNFASDMKGHAHVLLAPVSLVFAALLLGTYGYDTMPLVTASALLFLFIVFWRYARVIEKHVLKRTVKTSDLREGDVVEDMIWRGITKSEIEDLRRKKSHVVIKEGVRFVPAFPIAFVVTLLFGNLLFLVVP